MAFLGILSIFLAGFAAFAGVSSPSLADSVAPVRYRVDVEKSKFLVNARRGGLLWFKGHNHKIAVRDFSGVAELDLGSLNPASLVLNVRASSLEETDPVFTAQQKTIIKKELDELVLETAKYPEITFKSTSIKGKSVAGGFDIEIQGDLSLHGMTRPIRIPARVTVDANSIRAAGTFEIDRKDFNVKATSAFHGLIRVKHDLEFEFDIVAVREPGH